MNWQQVGIYADYKIMANGKKRKLVKGDRVVLEYEV